MREYQACIRRFAAGFLNDAAEGDDVAQRVLLDVWALHAALEPTVSVRAHLLARARHLCWTRARSRTRAKRWLRKAADQPHDACPTPLEVLVARDQEQAAGALGAQVAALVEQLDEEARTAIWMRFAGEATFEEIGKVLGRPPHAVRALTYRQIALLRKRLSEVAP